jgi:putative peptidoglycan lipid II flippase
MLALSIGTTLNIAMLVLVSLPSAFRLRLRWRLTLRFPPGVMRRAGGLALVGVLEFGAAALYGFATIDLANGHGTTGTLVLNNYGNLVFTAVCSVAPIAIVTASFPVLSATDGDEFDRASAGSSRAVMLMSWLGTALMIAVTMPAAHVLSQHGNQIRPLALSLLLYAPGVAGFAVVTNLSRVLFALGKLKVAGIALVAQQLLPAALSFAFVLLAPPRLATEALAAASSAGFLLVTVPTVLAVRRLRGAAAVAGLGHATLAGIAGSASGAAVGLLVTVVVPAGGNVGEVATGVVAGTAAVIVFGLVAYALDGEDMRVALSRLQRVTRNRG